MPAEAGIQHQETFREADNFMMLSHLRGISFNHLDSGFRRNDGFFANEQSGYMPYSLMVKPKLFSNSSMISARECLWF